MCVYIHRQFSAVVMGKSITPSCVCVSVSEREEIGLAICFCGALTKGWRGVIVSSGLCLCERVHLCVCICQYLIIMLGENCAVIQPVFELQMIGFVLYRSEINATPTLSQFTCETCVF